MAKSVTVSLRAGITKATLPNNVAMRTGVSYVISMDDYAKISNTARNSVISTDAFNAAAQIVPLWNGTNYALDLAKELSGASGVGYTTLALLNAALSIKDFKLGEVVQGFENDAFKLVKLDSGSPAATATRNVAVWKDEVNHVVTLNTDTETGDFAGVIIGSTGANYTPALAAGNFGWIQISGTVTDAAANADVAAGDTVAVSYIADGQFRGAEEGEVIAVVLDTFDSTSSGDEFTITIAGAGTSVVVTDDAAVAPEVAYAKAGLESAVAGLCFSGVGAPGITDGGFTLTFPSSAGDVGALTITDVVNGGAGFAGATSVTPTQQGSNVVGVGTALTSSGSTKADVELRSSGFANRHKKTAKLFLDKN